ncbi:hypothetical protein RclHR1_00890008 [Rhizophagus clarus]|uniref:Peptidase A2 domain-containing protein n=1 Tax=Rhizophagus clarus TaxID=94130 RepID=A0A2Z6SH70_9GLOM|nr:hypothetical protein RclHR1_00890008 [Rhizophagus clarus]
MIQFDDINENRILTDINLKDIREEIPKILKIKYLSDSSKESDGNINGIIYGLHHRLFCAATVKYKNKIKIVIFLVDTGSVMTFISEEVLDAFGIYLNPNCSMEVQINGRRTTIMASHSHFKEISLLGTGFMIAANANLHICCSNRSFYLNFSEPEDTEDDGLFQLIDV